MPLLHCLPTQTARAKMNPDGSELTLEQALSQYPRLRAVRTARQRGSSKYPSPTSRPTRPAHRRYVNICIHIAARLSSRKNGRRWLNRERPRCVVVSLWLIVGRIYHDGTTTQRNPKVDAASCRVCSRHGPSCRSSRPNDIAILNRLI